MEQWRLEEYRAYASLAVFRRRVSRARQIIEEALGRSLNWYLAWSGGKDSTALLHLIRTVRPDIPIIHVRTELDYPDCAETVDRWIEEWGLDVMVVRPDVSPWDILDEYGGPEGQVNNAASELDRRCFYEPINRAVAKHGFTGVFVGLRKHESRARMMNRATRGHIYLKADGMTVCTPLCDWTAKDVFAYHVMNELPWLPVYDRTAGHPDPERIREGWFIPGVAAVKHGGLIWLRRHYPRCFSELQRRYPSYTAQR